MTQHSIAQFAEARMPTWVPDSAMNYLAHTEAGLSIRALARRGGCHASTVLRQIRRVESRRDDPLVDTALRTLGKTYFKQRHTNHDLSSICKEPHCMTTDTQPPETAPDSATLNRESLRVLRRLCETGAVLAVAAEMEKSVVVRDGNDGSSTRTAVVDVEIARAMALKDWITCKSPARISRYHITQAGRAALSRMLAEQENRVRSANEAGFAEAQGEFVSRHRDGDETAPRGAATATPRRLRYNLAESPLTALARRKDRNGDPFLSDDLVTAGERLREDFELAQLGPRVTQNWERFLTGGARGGFSPGSRNTAGSDTARDRVSTALTDLGPGLSDVALRCCCFLEGLETAEKCMGWSARSGKIVLRIALQRLKRHYEEQGAESCLIG